MRSSFFAGIQGTSLVDLNAQADVWRDTVANGRVHQTTQAVPAARLAEAGLQPLGQRPDFDTSLYTTRRVARDACITFGGNRYSVPWRFVGRNLLVVIARHERD